MKSKSGKNIIINDAYIDFVFDSRDVDSRNEEKGFCINWDSNIGFGQLTIIQSNDNGCLKLSAETESMSNNSDKEFIKLVMNKLIDDLEVTE